MSSVNVDLKNECIVPSVQQPPSRTLQGYAISVLNILSLVLNVLLTFMSLLRHILATCDEH